MGPKRAVGTVSGSRTVTGAILKEFHVHWIRVTGCMLLGLALGGLVAWMFPKYEASGLCVIESGTQTAPEVNPDFLVHRNEVQIATLVSVLRAQGSQVAEEQGALGFRVERAPFDNSLRISTLGRDPASARAALNESISVFRAWLAAPGASPSSTAASPGGEVMITGSWSDTPRRQNTVLSGALTGLGSTLVLLALGLYFTVVARARPAGGHPHAACGDHVESGP